MQMRKQNSSLREGLLRRSRSKPTRQTVYTVAVLLQAESFFSLQSRFSVKNLKFKIQNLKFTIYNSFRPLRNPESFGIEVVIFSLRLTNKKKQKGSKLKAQSFFSLQSQFSVNNLKFKIHNLKFIMTAKPYNP